MENEDLKKINPHFQSVDFKGLTKDIFKIIEESESDFAKENKVDIFLEHNEICSYLAYICDRAIEQNDKITLFCFYKIGLLSYKDDSQYDELKKEFLKWFLSKQKISKEVDK